MKNISGRLFCLVLAVLMLIPIFAACKTETDPPQGSSDTAFAETFEITKELLASYVIVIPEGCSAALLDTADFIREQIKRKTGAELEIKIDYVMEGSELYFESEHEILVGLVDRDESKEFHSSLKSSDSGYTVINKKIVLAGHTDAAVDRSASYFQSDILSKDSDVIMTSADVRIVEGIYTYSDVKLNGVSLSEYTVVYARTNLLGEKRVATELADMISAVCGAVIPCVDDKSSEVSAHEIQIGDTNRVTDSMRVSRSEAGYNEKNFYYGSADNGVWISGSSYFSLSIAANRLMGLVGGTDGVGVLEIKEGVCDEYKSVSLKVFNYNVRYDLEDTARDPNGVIDTVLSAAPDVFGAIEVTSEWEKKLTDALSFGYTTVAGKKNQNTDNGEYNAIYFRKDRFELAEQGTKWLSKTPGRQSRYVGADHYMIFNYVILQDKETGVRFMYINVHFEPYQKDNARKVRALQAAQLRDFANAQSVPVIIAGDLNAIPKEEPIAILTTDSNLRYALNLAKEKTETAGTMVSEDYTTLGVRVYDYIFVDQRRISVGEYIMLDNKDANGKYPSDHIPVCATVTVYQ